MTDSVNTYMHKNRRGVWIHHRLNGTYALHRYYCDPDDTDANRVYKDQTGIKYTTLDAAIAAGNQWIDNK